MGLDIENGEISLINWKISTKIFGSLHIVKLYYFFKISIIFFTFN